MSTESFQTGGDQTTNKSFSEQNTDDNLGGTTDGKNLGISQEDLSALQKRDEHAQSHITTLETEASDLKTRMADMQERLDKASQVQELLDAKQPTEVDVGELTTKAVEQIEANLRAKEAQSKADSNFDAVSTALTEKFGDKTDEAVKKACAENDMSFDEMVDLSKKNPKLALKLCDVKVVVEQQSTRATLNSSAILDQYQTDQTQQKPVNVMELRTERARVDDFQRRLAEKLKTL